MADKGYAPSSGNRSLAAILGVLMTGGAFALVAVYLMMSVGSLLGLKDHPNRVGLWIAALIGIVITGGAIYGAFYQVKSPTLRPLYEEALSLLEDFDRVKLVHVPREMNSAADEMSNRAIDERL